MRSSGSVSSHVSMSGLLAGLLLGGTCWFAFDSVAFGVGLGLVFTIALGFRTRPRRP